MYRVDGQDGPEFQDLKEDTDYAMDHLRWIFGTGVSAEVDELGLEPLEHLLQEATSSQDSLIEHCLDCAKQAIAANRTTRIKCGLWLFVNQAVVHIGRKLLDHDFDLMDTAGYGDGNLLRTEATDSCCSEALCEIIVFTPGRPLSDENTNRLIKDSIRDHGTKRTILVVTQIDDKISKETGEPFSTILSYLNPAREEIARLETDQDESDEDAGIATVEKAEKA
ncbi:hypothetical protein BU23DRAFT_630651 [Bimuria novae-zelandiae CBS 107.79]|uniref:Uncharacterized protein n=1 Tax=Bimuria novae-zelandiae CBS 107.79 TaxID=1447943 RepID=A0A6A5UIG8_9PLEO|nr:hypothetical protein BU23DRAFT_630651 [Bimuria novae-zelandiae CBS 107.79]